MDERRDIDRRAEPAAADSARLEAEVNRLRQENGDVEVRRPAGDYEHSREWAAPGNERTTSRRQRTPEEIERDIARTRAEMTETINEIEERLSPQYFKQQFQDTVHETIDSVQERFSPSYLSHKARGFGMDMIDTVKQNPVPAILTAVGLAWWMRSASEQGGNDFRTPYARRYPRSRRGMYAPDYYGEDYYDYERPMARGAVYSDEPGYTGEPMYYTERVRVEADYYPEERGDHRSAGEKVSGKAQEMKHRAGDKAHELQHEASSKAHELQHRASETAHELQHRASDMAHEAQYRMRRAGRQARYGARYAGNWLDDMMHENPIAAGALALGVGALIGMALPRTHQEDEWMGEYRDELVHRGEEYVDKAKHVAERAAGDMTQSVKGTVKEVAKQSVKEVAKEATHAVKEEAKQEGMMGGSSGSSGSGSGSSGSTGSTGSTSGSSATRTSTTTGTTSDYSGTTPGRTGAGTGPIGGTNGPTGLERADSGVGPAAERNKPGSNL